MTGGHESHRYAGAREADGPDEVRKATREQLRMGADWVKLMASAGIGGMPDREHPSFTEFTLEELHAGVEEAHKRNRRVMAHAMSDESIRFCVEAGVDSIEHGVLMAPSTVRDVLGAGINLVPTLSGIIQVYERERASGCRQLAERLLKEVVEPQRHVVEQAIQEGIHIGTGSDTLGSVAEEIRLLVACGMSKERALEAATVEGARILGLEETLGTIETGKQADLVVLGANPLEDLGAYSDIRGVVLRGQPVRHHPRMIPATKGRANSR
jgi:imidazolonepropionase-like amidohydrolase